MNGNQESPAGGVSAGRIENAWGFRLIESGRPLERFDLPPLEAGAGEVIVEVAGCGICHTDVGFAVDGVPTRHALPLILGHEISGIVVAAGDGADDWQGKRVIVPAVAACGACGACEAGRPTICRRQFMPGNHGDGGFASHVKVPALGLCPVPDELPEGLTLAHLSVVADAVTTPLEAMGRGQVGPDDVVVVVGAGGVGGFGVQIAAAFGAAVAALDVDEGRLELAASHGASLTLNPAAMPFKELKKAIRSFAKESGKTGVGLKIFETSGTPAGQNTAYGLLDPGAYLGVVGYTPAKVELRLSNLMAFDATAQGNWGSAPERYPEALELVLAGKIQLGPYVEMHPMEDTPRLLQAVADHEMKGRVILVPGREI